MTDPQLSLFVKEQAFLLGFDACGIAAASELPEEERARFSSWLTEKRHAKMSYMENHFEKRMDPRLLVPGCQSVVVVALNYFPRTKQRPSTPKVARFAYGTDYHDVIRSKLRTLIERLNEKGFTTQGRAFSDSAPIAERFWAQKAGLGWIGKNNLLILPGKGSYYLLGILLLDRKLTPDKPQPNRCGSCTQCRSACPTKALSEFNLNAAHCLSYLTIERRGEFAQEEAKKVGENEWIFGCDLCQESCPWNRFATGNEHPELQPKYAFLSMETEDFHQLDLASFKSLFQGTCLERTGLEGLQRNLRAKRKPGNPKG
jgi:epoxyqueuosine reductase